jgi:hypothetical protein
METNAKVGLPGGKHSTRQYLVFITFWNAIGGQNNCHSHAEMPVFFCKPALRNAKTRPLLLLSFVFSFFLFSFVKLVMVMMLQESQERKRQFGYYSAFKGKKRSFDTLRVLPHTPTACQDTERQPQEPVHAKTPIHKKSPQCRLKPGAEISTSEWKKKKKIQQKQTNLTNGNLVHRL